MMRVKVKMKVEEYKNKLNLLRQSWEGSEKPDPVPMAPPIGYKKQPSMVEHIREMVRSEHLRLAAEAAGQETFEEADDFDVEDEIDPPDNYRVDHEFEPPLPSPAPVAEGGGEAAGSQNPPAAPPPAPPSAST